MRKTMVDLFAGQTIIATQELLLAPYQLMILSRYA
jgi:amylosucrase/maltose alpha-D-glucosyltransferase/alpha-amylase